MKNQEINKDDLQELIIDVCKNNGVRVDAAYSIAEEVLERIVEAEA